MWLSEIFSVKELENRTKGLYRTCRGDYNEIIDKFEDFFGISYKLAFGSEDPKICITNLLNEYYQNECYIKDAFSSKYLKSEKTIYEYPINDSRADIIDICNSLSCYEIKTKYDNLSRLCKQLKDYSKVFEYVYVVCSEDKYNDVKKMIPSYCGIISYKDRKNCSFNKRVNASKSPNINIYEVLNCFNKKELNKCFGLCDRHKIQNKYDKQEIINNYKKIISERYLA